MKPVQMMFNHKMMVHLKSILRGDLGSVRDAIEAAGFKIDNAEVTMIPSTTVDLDLETAPKLLRLIDMLEDCDDVQNVYHNGEISDEVAAQL